MTEVTRQIRLHGRLVNGLYVEATLLADKAATYFSDQGREDGTVLDPFTRARLGSEALKISIRLMHVLAWLHGERAGELGAPNGAEIKPNARRLGEAAPSDAASIADLPAVAVDLIRASQDLYARITRLQGGAMDAAPCSSPALHLLDRLERAF